MSDAFWAALFGFLAVFATQVLQVIQANRREVRQAVKVEEVKETLAVTNAAMTEKIGEVHTLVNGLAGERLRSGALSARALYSEKPTDANRALMDKANEDLAKHEATEAAIRGDKPMYTHRTHMSPGGPG